MQGSTPVALTALTALAVVKGSPGQIASLAFLNTNASVSYIQVFDAATVGAVTLGTTPPKAVFGIPASGSITHDLGTLGLNFLNGIVAAATTTATGLTTVTTGLAGTIAIL